MTRDLKQRPAYAITSVDHALRLATILQLEGSITVAVAAERLGVARSTAHRLLAMLVYRDFARQDDARSYCPGPVLELAAHSRSLAADLREAALAPMATLVGAIDETANLIVRAGDTARFIASVECRQALRVGSREGMVFPVHRVSGGLVLLADLPDDEVMALYAVERFAERQHERPELAPLLRDLARVRSSGLALNQGRSERGVVAIGRAVRDPAGRAVAGISISMPSVRYAPTDLPRIDAALRACAAAITAALLA